MSQALWAHTGGGIPAPQPHQSSPFPMSRPTTGPEGVKSAPETFADLSLLCLWPFGNSLTETVHSEFYQCHTQNRSRALGLPTLQRDSRSRSQLPATLGRRSSLPPSPQQPSSPHTVTSLTCVASAPKDLPGGGDNRGEGLNTHSLGEGGARCPHQGASGLHLNAQPPCAQPTLTSSWGGSKPSSEQQAAGQILLSAHHARPQRGQ